MSETTPETDATIGLEQAPSARRNTSLRLRLIASGLGACLVLSGLWYWRGASEREYFQTLETENLLHEFANRDVALTQAHAFCAELEAGGDARGFRRQKAAVDAFCASFAAGFVVVPTPEEQQATLLQKLRDSGLGGKSPSDAAAVAAARAVCTRLDQGGVSQGVKSDAIAVEVYCNKYLSGFRVLEEIKVRASITIYNSSYYYPTIGMYKGHCYGRNGYSDIDEGTRAVVKNAAGKILAETTLSAGSGGYSKCKFTFEFTVLEGESKYRLEVSHRGALTYTEAQLKIPGRVHLYLG